MIITYVGKSDVRVISSSDFTSQGLTSPTLTWNKANGFSVDVEPDVGAFLLAQGEFVADDGSVFGDVVAGVVQPADFGVLFRVPTVKYFGAVGDGVANDTVAIQAAIDANREVVFPEGKYKAGQLVLRRASRMIGEGRSDNADEPGAMIDSTIVGLSGTPAAIKITATSFDKDSGIRIENLWVKGHASESPDYTSVSFPSWGIRGQTQVQSLRVEHSVISGFNINVELDDCRYSVLDQVILKNAVDYNLILLGLCDHVAIRDCCFIVVNEVGTAHADVNLANVWIAQRNASQYPKLVSITGTLLDEVARNGQVNPPVTLKIDKADDCSFERLHVYYPVGASGGNGRGIDLVAGTRNTFRKIQVNPYVADAGHVPLHTIRIAAAATRNVLQDIQTNPNTANGGVDISDLSPDTEWRNVNGESRPILKAPNGTRYKQTMDNAGLPVYTAIP